MACNVTFLIGRAGSGKSRAIQACLKDAMQHGRRAVLLVPEQFTYEAERRLGEALGGLMGIQVLSFTRLSERVLAARALETPFLSQQGRRMVFRRAAYRQQRHLAAFGTVAHRPGFAARMDELFSMCKRFLIAPSDLSAAAAALPDGAPLKDKLSDLSLLFSEAQDYLDSRYLDSEDAFYALLRALPQSFMAGAEVYVDGFDLLTGQLYQIFETLLSICSSITFSICMDPDPNCRDKALFQPEERVYARLRAMCESLGATVTTHRLTAPETNTPIAHMERELFAVPGRTYPMQAEEVTILCASDRTAEMETIADEILRLARQGIRYRDMAVIVSDMAAYATPLQRALARRNIPVFLDACRAMEGHPAVELINAAVSACAQGLPAKMLLRICKTGLAGISVDACEVFENYLLRYGIKGGRQVSEPFTRGEVPPQAEAARAALTEPLLRLLEKLKAPEACKKAEAVYDYLEELGVCEQLQAQTEELRLCGRFSLMQEHAQVWQVIVEVLDQLHGILGNTPLSRREFCAVLEEAFSGYQVGVIPATADQVLLGSVSRTRSRSVRALFIIGCNEGLLPACHEDNGIIDDGDLKDMAALGLTPWGDSTRRAENDRLDLYRALSKARERLYVGYACSDGREELLPSSLILDLARIFPHHRSLTAGAGQPLPLPQSRESGFLALMDALREGREDTPFAKALMDYYQNDPAFQSRTAHALWLRNAPISPSPFGPALAKQLYGSRIVTAATRLEHFNTCPFRHYMQHGLKAQPRREFRERPEDMGSFCHMVLEQFTQKAGEIGWEQMDETETDRLLDVIFPACMAAYQEGFLASSPRSAAMAGLWMDILRHAAHSIVKQIQAGRFRPLGAEVRFGPNETFPPIRLTLKDGTTALLCGVIDRVDIARDTGIGQELLRVVDYKTQHAEMDLGQMLSGIQMQLPLYLAAAQQARRAANTDIKAGEPLEAGLFYQPVKDPDTSASTPDAVEKAYRLSGLLLQSDAVLDATDRGLNGHSRVVKGLKTTKDGVPDGPLVNHAAMQKLLRHTRALAEDTLARIMDGRAEASPVSMGAAGSACAYCMYRSVCRFETSMPGCRVRRREKMNHEAFLKFLEQNE